MSGARWPYLPPISQFQDAFILTILFPDIETGHSFKGISHSEPQLPYVILTCLL